MEQVGEASRALARGEALRALALVGRLETSIGLTLRGIAYAQIGDLVLARRSLERASALEHRPLGLARIQAALVEIALTEGDPASAARAARASAETLTELGDARNAMMQRLVLARAEVLLGRLDEARRTVDEVLAAKLGPDLRAVASLARAEIAVRAVRATAALAALTDARRALADSSNELLARALVALERELAAPIARLQRGGAVRDADLFAIESASRGDVLLVDACRRLAIAGRASIVLAKRPVMFALLFALARAWPNDLGRDALAGAAFEAKKVNASHRARLRVEIGRLRKILHGVAEPVATAAGYALRSRRDVVLLLPPTDGEDARLAILLGDGASWSAQALAEHAGVSRRTAQRVLAAMVERGAVVRTGKGRFVRYARPGAPIASRMLLLGLVPKT
ncbi:MAG: HTH domain-containing protein [Labilithrix sp.]|nr:HTH domain-containing protein [Labilithrix sp.]